MKKNLTFIFCVSFFVACLEPGLFVAHAGKIGGSFIQPGNTPRQGNQNYDQNNINSVLGLDSDTSAVTTIDPNDNDFKMDDGDLSHFNCNGNGLSSIQILGIRNPLTGNKRKTTSSLSSSECGRNLRSKSQKRSHSKVEKIYETKEVQSLSLSDEKEISALAGGVRGGELPDALVSLIGNYLDDSKGGLVEFSGLCGFFEVKGPLTTKQHERRAQEEIRELIGEFKWIEPGSMIAGATPEEPNSFECNLPQRHVEIKERFGMPVTDVTVKNYKYLYGERMDEATVKKPMTGRTRKQWVYYAAELTLRLKELFPLAYPALKFREAKVPGEAEKDYIEYATTIPIDPRLEEFPKGSGEYVRITAEHSVYSGVNLIVRTDTLKHQREDKAKLKRFVDFGRDFNEGPADVDLVAPNPRGLKGLSGGVSKIIDVPYDPNITEPDLLCRVVAGDWNDGFEDVRVCSRSGLCAVNAAPWAGVRLVLLFFK